MTVHAYLVRIRQYTRCAALCFSQPRSVKKFARPILTRPPSTSPQL
jgi:hypothetical protein